MRVGGAGAGPGAAPVLVALFIVLGAADAGGPLEGALLLECLHAGVEVCVDVVVVGGGGGGALYACVGVGSAAGGARRAGGRCAGGCGRA